MYNKHNLAITKITAPSTMKPAFGCVAFFGNRTVATDSFRLIEVEADGKAHAPILHRSALVKKIKLKKNETTNEDSFGFQPVEDEFPAVDDVLNKENGVRYTEVHVNGKLLGELLQLMAGMTAKGAVVLRVPTVGTAPIRVENVVGKINKGTKARGLVMPIMIPR